MNDFLSLPNEHIDVYALITKQGASYQARVIAQDKSNSVRSSELMQTSEPLSRMLLEQLLESFGFHQNEVFDALDINDGESAQIKHPLW